MSERVFEPAPLQYSYRQAEEDAFPVSKHEVDGWCKRLRNLADPVISPETWAAAVAAFIVASVFALVSLPDKKHHSTLVGFYAACIVFFVLLAAFLIWLSIRLRKDRSSDAELVAEEMETIRDKRLPAKRSETSSASTS